MSPVSLHGSALTVVCLATVLAGCASNPLSNRNDSATTDTVKANPSQRSSSSSEYQQQLVHGKAAEQSGQWDRARSIYEKLIAQDPHRAEAFHRLGVSADHQKDFDRAHEYMAQAIRLDPKNAEIWGDLGYCLYLKAEMEPAESALAKAIALAPETARFHNNLGMVYGHMDRMDEAFSEFEQAGTKADAMYNLAFIYLARDNLEQASACMERCLAIDPSHKKARQALESYKKHDDSSDVMPASYVDDGVHWIPYVEGMEKREPTLQANQNAGSAQQQSLSPNRNAGNRVRQLQSKTQQLMNNRMNRPTMGNDE